MYLTLPQTRLNPALRAVQMIARKSHASQPILSYVLLTADAAGLVLHAANEETRLSYRVAADVQAPGSALLPVGLFTGFVSDLPAAPLVLVSPSPTDSLAVQVRCQQVKANMKVGSMSLDEFPRVVPWTAACQEILTLDCELLREIVEHVAFAANTDASPPILEGIRLACDHGQAMFSAADSFRLAVETTAIPDQRLTLEIVIPARTMRYLAQLLPPTGSVRLALSETGHHLLVQTREMTLSTRLLEGTYPPFHALLEVQASTRLHLPTQAFADAVRLMALFTREGYHRLQLHIAPTQPDAPASLLLQADAPDVGANEIRLEEQVQVQGGPLSLLLNEKFLSEILARIETAQVELELSSARTPVVIKPVGPRACVYVCMPLHQNAPTPAPRSSTPETETVVS